VRKLLTEVTVVPVRPARQVIERGVVGYDTDTGLLTDVGTMDEIRVRPGDAVEPMPGHIVTPGLVNAHGHAVQTLYKGTQEGRPLELWRQYIKARDRCVDGGDIECGVTLSAVELLRGGCTTTLEHYYSAVEEPHMGGHHVLEAWEHIGIRGVFAAMISDVDYGRTVGLSDDEVDGDARAEIARISRSERAETVEEASAFVRMHRTRSDRISFLLGPSAPHRCSDEMIEGVARAAGELGVGWHMHVGETRPQRELTLRTYGVTPVGRLAGLGVLTPTASLAHGIWCDEDDLDLLAATGPTVVHNPSSNLKLGSGIAPVPAMLERAIPVALGTDGSASNDGQSLLEAMKLAAILQGAGPEPFPRWPTAWDVLEMATIGGARAVGLADRIGSLEVGKDADLVVFGRTPALVPLNDPVRQLVLGPATGAVRHVVVGGADIIRDGHVRTVDEHALYDEVQGRVDARRDQFAEAVRGVAALEPALRKLYLEG
jgi:5-methylthioadenosine/S-adenosylhomocysteine deaminase